jgi:hypothetical protein
MSAEPATSRGRRVALTVVFAVVGVALLAWQIVHAGPHVIKAQIARVGAGFAVILFISVVRFFLRSIAWTTLIAEPVSVWRALAATIAGDALGNITPLNLIVSEPAKAVYLGRSVPAARGLAALTAENFFYSISVAIYIVLGTAAFLLRFDLTPALRWTGVAALGAMAVVLAAATWLAWERPGLASAIAARVPVRKVRDLVGRIRTFEQDAYGSVGHHGGILARIVVYDAIFHVLSFIEAYYTLWLLTGEWLPVHAFVLDTFSRVSNIIFRLIPFKLGADQAGSEQVALAVGLASGIGTSVSLVRTMRVIVWAAVGLVLLVRRTARAG